MATIHEIRGVRASLRSGAAQLAQQHKARVESDGGSYVDLDKVTEAIQFLTDNDYNYSITNTAHWSDVYFGIKVNNGAIAKSYCLFGNDAIVYNTSPVYSINPNNNKPIRKWGANAHAGLHVPTLDLSNTPEMTTFSHFSISQNFGMLLELGADVNSYPGFFVWSGDSNGSQPYYASRLSSDMGRYNNRFANDAFIPNKVYNLIYSMDTRLDVDTEGAAYINGVSQNNNWFSNGRVDLLNNYPNASLYIGIRGNNTGAAMNDGYLNSSMVIPKKLTDLQSKQLTTIIDNWNK